MNINFNYWEKEEWVSYIDEFIIPIKNKADIIFRFWDYLSDNYSSMSILDIKDNKLLLEKLLGGIKVNGEYKDRSAALFYKNFFGWELEDVGSYLNNQEEGIEMEIETKINETIFIEFLKELEEICDIILDMALEKGLISSTCNNDSDIDFDILLNSDEKVIETIKELYDQILKFTINYNDKTLFLWTIRKITKRFLCFQYHNICKGKNFETMMNLLGMNGFYSPDIDENSDNAKKIIDEYTIWELKEYGLGCNICKLHNFIFRKFKENKEYYVGTQLWDCLKFIFPNHKDLEKEYIDSINRKLISWKMPDYISTYGWGGSGKPYWHYAKYFSQLSENSSVPNCFRSIDSFSNTPHASSSLSKSTSSISLISVIPGISSSNSFGSPIFYSPSLLSFFYIFYKFLSINIFQALYINLYYLVKNF